VLATGEPLDPVEPFSGLWNQGMVPVGSQDGVVTGEMTGCGLLTSSGDLRPGLVEMYVAISVAAVLG
jgi:hypothetical protein